MSNQDYETNIHLRAICQLNLRNRQVGAYLLESNNNYSLRFGFTFQGIHPFIGHSKMSTTVKGWNEGVRGFLPGEIVRIHQRSYSDTQEREAELEERADACGENPGLQVLNYYQQRHTRELSKKGKRCLYENHIFTSWGYKPGESADQDLIENLFGQMAVHLSRAYSTFKGEQALERQEILKEVFSRGFDESFVYWEEQLNSKLGLKVVPMQAASLWSYAWKQFNQTEEEENPHLITATEVESGQIEIREEISSRLCPASVLIQGEEGLPSIPSEHFSWLKVKGQYVAAMVLEEKLDGYEDRRHQFELFWKPFKVVPDLEVVWSAEPSNLGMDNFNLKRTVNFQKKIDSYTKEKGGHSVDAEEEIKDSLEAQRNIYRGDYPVNIAVTFFLTRRTVGELNSACKRLARCFPQKKVIRETDISPELWRRKQPFVNRQLVDTPLRIHTYSSSKVSLPVLSTKTFEARGIELITKEGVKPIYIDTGRTHHNRLVVAQTRKGKSTKIGDEIVTDLSYGVPVIVLDHGMVDGSNTYSPIVNYLVDWGANIDVAHTDYNLIQAPDLSKLSLSSEDKLKREEAFQTSILSSLETVILGEERETRFARRLRSVFDSLIVQFFQQPEIQARYKAAHRAGIGSKEWLEMPTLPALRDFAAEIDLEEIGGELSSEGRGEIVMMLSNFIRSPFGSSFSRPSKVKLDARFLNFSLRGARNKEETTILGTIAQTLATTRAMEYIKSSFYVDEGSILFKKPALVEKTVETVANGGKSGISVTILAQDIPSIANWTKGSELLTNTDIKMIGAIDESDIGKLAEYLDRPAEFFARNAQEDFEPDPINLCSHWLMLAEGTRLYVSHYPSPELMALIASNPPEQEARKRYFDAYEDPIEALPVFAIDYQNAKRRGIPMSELVPPTEKSRLIFA